MVASRGETLVTGDSVNVAARLEQSAQSGEILLGEQTYGLVRDVALVEAVDALVLKGKAKPVSAWRLISVLPDIPVFTRPVATLFIGRERELVTLESAFACAVAERSCRLVGRFCGFQRLDLALRRVQLLEAEAVELLAPLPELDRVVEVGLAGFELLDDLFQLALSFLVRHLAALAGVGSRRAKPGSAAA